MSGGPQALTHALAKSLRYEKDSRLTHLLFDFISEVAASIDIPDVQKYPVVAESALQLGREMIRRPASVGPAKLIKIMPCSA